MSDNRLLNQIGNLIDNKLEPIKKDLGGVKKQLNGMQKQLDTVELKVELVNDRVNKLGGQLNQTEKRLEKVIVKSKEKPLKFFQLLFIPAMTCTKRE